MHDATRSERRVRQLEQLLQTARQHQVFDYSRLRIARLPACDSGLAYFELGDPQGTPLLCLHGLSISGYFFESSHADFQRLGIRAIAPCLLGGIALAEPARSVDAMADELLELLDQLGIARADLLGFSWGTLPQLALLARAPQRFRRAALLGPMLPTRFSRPEELKAMKPDVRLSLRMAGKAAWLHRALMALVCRLPIAALMRQFEDVQLSAAEREALAPDSHFHRHFAGSVQECIATGSGFFTQGWRAFLDEPGYTLADLAGVATQVDLHFFVGEHDNVHLPAVAQRLAAACAPAAQPAKGSPVQQQGEAGAVFQALPSSGPARLWMAPGAGRLACILYVGEALAQLVADPSAAVGR